MRLKLDALFLEAVVVAGHLGEQMLRREHGVVVDHVRVEQLLHTFERQLGEGFVGGANLVARSVALAVQRVERVQLVAYGAHLGAKGLLQRNLKGPLAVDGALGICEAGLELRGLSSHDFAPRRFLRVTRAQVLHTRVRRRDDHRRDPGSVYEVKCALPEVEPQAEENREQNRQAQEFVRRHDDPVQRDRGERRRTEGRGASRHGEVDPARTPADAASGPDGGVCPRVSQLDESSVKSASGV